MRKKELNFELYLVTDRKLSKGRKLEDIVASAVNGGATIIQLREKECSTREFIEFGKKIRAILKSKNIPLIINDRIDVALAVKADGVHIGQNDMSYQTARNILGKGAIIGLSVESVQDAIAAEKFDVDYLGLSPIYSTPTKTDIQHELGLEGIREIREISKHKLVAIGGIKTYNTKEIIQAGADGIAVVSAICSAEDPENSARELRAIVRNALKERK